MIQKYLCSCGKIVKYFPVFFVFFLASQVRAQGGGAMHRVFGEFGIGVGTAHYIGDLSPRVSFKSIKPSGTIFFRTNMGGDAWVFRTNIAMGTIGADESKSSNSFHSSRGLTFSSTIIELSGIIEYNFLDFRSASEEKIHRFYSPYLFAGFGIASVSSNEQNETPSGTVFSLPIGIGIKYKLSNKFNIGAEFGARKTFTDLLDGYANNDLTNTSLGDDTYFFSHIILSYSIVGTVCPEPSKMK